MHPSDPMREAWIKAMQEEWNKLWKNGTYEWVTQEEAEKDPNYTAPISQTWDLKIKKDKDRRPYEVKARLCLRGDLAMDDLSVGDVFAPTCSYETIRLLVALSAYYGQELYQADISSAFLNSEVPEGKSIYAKQSPGPAIPTELDDSGRPKILKLKMAKKVIYSGTLLLRRFVSPGWSKLEENVA